jgi:predicted dienelactone hydrolase
MRCLICPVSLLVVLVSLHGAESPPASYKHAAGPSEIDTLLIDWRDAKRDREIPVKLYVPQAGAGPLPVLVFSHGLGGSRGGYEYLGRHWGSHGYVCVHIQHKGSDDAVWKGKENRMEELRKAVRVPANILNRPADVSFALDQLEKMNKEGRLKGRLDLEKVGLAGHSFGAFTTLACAGQTFFTARGGTTGKAESRVKAAIAMSPQPQAGRRVDRKKAYATIKIPIFHMTGTEDDGVAITEAKPADRRVPYDHIPAPGQYLLTLTGGDHMVFAGLKKGAGRGKRDHDPRFHDLIRMSSTAFWDAHLKGDAKAKAWLSGEFKAALGRDGTFEFK